MFYRDHDLIRRYLSYLADGIGLHEWGLSLDTGDPEQEDAAGMCYPFPKTQTAVIVFNWDYMEQNGEEVFRRCAVHELLHCHFAAMDTTVHSAEQLLGTIGWSVFSSAWDLAMETCLDAIATVLARQFLLPSAWLEEATA